MDLKTMFLQVKLTNSNLLVLFSVILKTQFFFLKNLFAPKYEFCLSRGKMFGIPPLVLLYDIETKPKTNFPKAPFAPIYTNIEGERARKNANFWSKPTLQKKPKYKIFCFLQNIAYGALNMVKIGLYSEIEELRKSTPSEKSLNPWILKTQLKKKQTQITASVFSGFLDKRI